MIKTGRPVMPDGYGVPENDETLLPWDYVDSRMAKARNYWIITVSPNGAPAATPVWGVWFDDKLYFDGAPSTRRGRNIMSNPRTLVHLESGDEVVILEGQTVILQGAPERSLAERVASEYTQKYASQGYSPTPDQWDQGGLFIFTPTKAIGWSKFPEDVTRWKLGG
ncbi:MAG: pyridoxamine 5'-phosphate oxidase [Chloroflexi bacterium]|nr:pyridoxamine 5'-phosphate oxidase [Chloroflexota bacterium]